jgi:uncharacterized membrane protein
MYDVALFLHICGVVLLVGAVTTTMLATLRAQKAETVAELRSLTAVTKTIDMVIGPAMLLILAPGLYMVSRHGDDGSIRWTSGWVDVAIAVFLLMAVLGPAVETRHAKRLLQAAQDLPDGPVPPDVDALRRTPVATYVTMFGAGQIVAFLFLMTNQPALPGAIATCVIAAVVSLTAGFLRLRSLGPAASEPAARRAAVSSDAAGTR